MTTASSAPPRLPARTLEAVTYAAQGFTDIQIGRLMDISPRTVETMIRRAKRKLDLDGCTRTTLIHAVIEQGIITMKDNTNELARAFDAGKHEAVLQAQPVIDALADLAFGWQSHAPAETVGHARMLYEEYIKDTVEDLL